MTTETTKIQYHHGDLRQSLIDAATDMIREGGIDSLSLRKLAEQVGVSRTAPYHHFKDKNELLCAIAESAFQQHYRRFYHNNSDSNLPAYERLKRFVHGYVQYAHENPELYELMFGHRIWKKQSSTAALKDIAYPTFQLQVEMTKSWQEQGLLNPDENTLRLAQVIWGTLHGIAKLLNDGVYTDTAPIEEMCDCAVRLFTTPSEHSP